VSSRGGSTKQGRSETSGIESDLRSSLSPPSPRCPSSQLALTFSNSPESAPALLLLSHPLNNSSIGRLSSSPPSSSTLPSRDSPTLRWPEGTERRSREPIASLSHAVSSFVVLASRAQWLNGTGLEVESGFGEGKSRLCLFSAFLHSPFLPSRLSQREQRWQITMAIFRLSSFLPLIRPSSTPTPLSAVFPLYAASRIGPLSKKNGKEKGRGQEGGEAAPLIATPSRLCRTDNDVVHGWCLMIPVSHASLASVCVRAST
jgi:hypothetical protein